MAKTVCIVDDQPTLRQMLRFVLNAQGLNVLEAENGVDAIKKLSDKQVDMMIVDWQMPMMDGMELIRKLRKEEAYAELPIIVISCRDDLRARQEARSLGVMTWLKKPFRMAEVQRVVENGLGLVVRSSISPSRQVESRNP